MYSIESFKKKVNMLHIELSDKQYNQYVTYYEMVVEKNKVMNLTGITEFDELISIILTVYRLSMRWICTRFRVPLTWEPVPDFRGFL